MKLFLIWILSMVVIMLMMMCSCGTKPQEQLIMNSQQWENSIWNKDNAEFVDEVAFNEGVASSLVTQEMFDQRYSN